MACIEARGLRKAFGTTIALDGVNLRIEEGCILGLVGTKRRGQDHRAQHDSGPHYISGRTDGARTRPWTERDQLMRDVCFIAHVAVLPPWVRVSQALDYMALS